jgi:Cu-processing system ATP-binding protein
LPASDAETVIALRQVSKTFGAVQAVSDIDLEIRRGEMLGLIGHNGAGKSTLFKMMLGLLPVSSGEIRVSGVDIASPGFRDVRRQIGYLPEHVVLYDNLTGLETLKFFGRLKGVAESHCGPVLERVGLSHAADRRVNGYSKGMRQRLGFAQALLGSPRLLFLDEPTSGLDPEAIRDFYRMLADLRHEGVTMVLTSHILAEIQERADRLAILAAGRMQALGTLQSLREQVHLPLRIRISTMGELAADFAERFSGEAFDFVRLSSSQFELRCAREHKMQVLARVAQHGDSIRDVQMLEPSLEDVFFGLAG